MTRRHRIERAVTDAGYAPGWVVLDAEGNVITERPTHAEALDTANRLALGHGLDGLVTERLDAEALDQLGVAEHVAAIEDRLTAHLFDMLSHPRRAT